MFFIFGTKYKKRKVENGIIETRFCQKCNKVVTLHEYVSKKYFALFFLPIIPLGEESHFLHCEECGTDYYLEAGATGITDKAQILEEDKGISITCPQCKKEARIKMFEKETTTLKCPHCSHIFEVKKNYKG